jgi:hypothetical protein|tara:strand:- start:3754 stop:4041 length:288 start_codon:yes stop_codon:yes gene_type:complete
MNAPEPYKYIQTAALGPDRYSLEVVGSTRKSGVIVSASHDDFKTFVDSFRESLDESPTLDKVLITAMNLTLFSAPQVEVLGVISTGLGTTEDSRP